MRRSLAVAGAVLAACSAAVPQAPARATPPAASASGERVVASGELALPAAAAFGQPGFHEALTFTAALPADAGGRTLVLRLRDAGRPAQVCGSEHPLSGCATVDWSDDPTRPKVPSGGVFDNSLALRTPSGTTLVHLRASGRLAATPEAFEPG